jgi:predicted nuclease of predicted toxin-antitoxin system
VDAQLPRRLTRELTAFGHDAFKTLDLPVGNRTPDGEIVAMAIRENYIVITKDNDFVTSFLLRGAPPIALLISTGNISNDRLSKLIAANLTALENAFSKYDFIELSGSVVIIHA